MRYYKIRLIFIFAMLTFVLVGISVTFWKHDSAYSVPKVKESKVKSFSFR